MESFTKGNKKKYIVLIICILLVGSLAACSNESPLAKDEEVVAKVDGLNITKDELYDLMVQQYGTQALNSLIGQKMAELEIDKLGIEVPEEEIEEKVTEIMEYYGEEGLFNEEDVREGITMDLQLKKLLEPNINITEEEISDFFQENKAYFDQKEQVRARHILVETKEEGEKIKSMIDEGEDFSELAKEHSIDKASGEVGGELGFFGRGEMVPTFDEAAFSMEEGEISDLVKSDLGYHIIKLEEKKEAKEAELEDFEDIIKDIMLEDRLPEAYQQWFETTYQEYEIINNLIPNEN